VAFAFFRVETVERASGGRATEIGVGQIAGGSDAHRRAPAPVFAQLFLRVA
jgi:hypothetical protein